MGRLCVFLLRGSSEQRAASSEKRRLMMKLRGRLVKDELKASLEKVQFKVGG